MPCSRTKSIFSNAFCPCWLFFSLVFGESYLIPMYVNMPNQGWSRGRKKSSSADISFFHFWFDLSIHSNLNFIYWAMDRGAHNAQRKKLWDTQKEQQPWMEKKKKHIWATLFLFIWIKCFFSLLVSLFSGSVHITIDHCILLHCEFLLKMALFVYAFSFQLLSSFVDGNVIFA